ncbi:hypothetical protein FRC20_001981 [Serendipita sp. 405]|nr:hypothetical protein FRC20_001981 [Serendipita sp. 405]
MSSKTNPTMNTAAVLHGAGHLTVEQRPRTTPPPGYAEVKIMSTTLCGSDRERPMSSLRPSDRLLTVFVAIYSPLLRPWTERNIRAPTSTRTRSRSSRSHHCSHTIRKRHSIATSSRTEGGDRMRNPLLPLPILLLLVRL